MARVLPPSLSKVVSAFSLVEVTLALGVISVSLLSLLGLLPAGLGVLRNSMEQTVHAQIVQRVAAEISSTDFNALSNQSLLFDDEGQLLAATDSSKASYLASIQGSNASLPGLTNQADVDQLQSYLKRVRIGISRTNGPSTAVTWYAIQASR